MQPQYVQGGQPQYVVAQPQQPQYYAQAPQQQGAYGASAPPGYYQPQMQQGGQQQPQPYYQQGQPGQGVVVMGQVPVQQQTEIVVIETGPQPQYGGGFSREVPAMCVCPNCRQTVSTNVSTEPGAQTWFCFCSLLLLFWPAACLPFCIPSCQDVTHSCPACGVVITRITG